MIKKLQALKAKKGFTLVELVVVIAIIGVLAAILVPTMLGVVEDSRITSANTLATNIKNRVTEFFGKMDALKASYTGGAATIVIKATGDGKWGCALEENGKKADESFLDKKDHFGSEADITQDVVNNKDTELVAYIADSTSDMKSCYIKIYVGSNGKVTGVAAVEGTSEAPTNIPAADDFKNGTFSGWSGKAGVIEGNMIIGTAPVLGKGDAQPGQG